jgi:hypothetical protein
LKINQVKKEYIYSSSNRKNMDNNASCLTKAKNWASLIQSIVTILAIIAAGIWFFWRGEASPKANIVHEVVHRQITDKWIWLHISTIISNVGKSSLEINSGIIRVQQILPLDQIISEKIKRNESPIDQEAMIVLWPQIGDTYSPKINMKIEPSENDRVKCEFIIPSYVRTIKIYSYFKKAEDSTVGWSTATIYDFNKI